MPVGEGNALAPPMVRTRHIGELGRVAADLQVAVVDAAGVLADKHNRVRRVRLRMHPSESCGWYRRFIDEKFFEPDRADLASSLAASSLVVGPTSTVFLESLLAGVNYLVYEPALKGLDVVNYPLVPPFDGTEPGIPAAYTDEELGRMLDARSGVDPSVLGGYIKTPFDLSAVADIVPRHA